MTRKTASEVGTFVALPGSQWLMSIPRVLALWLGIRVGAAVKYGHRVGTSGMGYDFRCRPASGIAPWGRAGLFSFAARSRQAERSGEPRTSNTPHAVLAGIHALLGPEQRMPNARIGLELGQCIELEVDAPRPR